MIDMLAQSDRPVEVRGELLNSMTPFEANSAFKIEENCLPGEPSDVCEAGMKACRVSLGLTEK